MQGEIEHTGIVQKISDNKITVGIISESACASCHAKGACTMADIKEKNIEITRFHDSFCIGQRVRVVGRLSQGVKATFWGYILPFVIVILTLIISGFFTENEGVRGVLALGILVPYYFILFLFRNKMKKVLEFEIKTIQ